MTKIPIILEEVLENSFYASRDQVYDYNHYIAKCVNCKFRVIRDYIEYTFLFS